MQTIRAAALWALFVLQAVMAAALFSGTAPHPPAMVPLFAMGPFLAASLALAAAAIAAGRGGSATLASCLALAATVPALISYGPQKWLDPAIGAIWPAVAVGEAAVLAVILTALHDLVRRRP